MSQDRRAFLSLLAAVGAQSSMGTLNLAAAEALQTGALATDRSAVEFWSTFLQFDTPPSRPVGSEPPRSRQNPNGMEKEAFFFFYGDDGFQPALDLHAEQLVPNGDITVSLNVAAFKPAAEDRATFERLQNAQLRMDVVQTNPLMALLDPMAWTAVAVLNPDKTSKLPPLQNLSFDPTATSEKMRSIVLPGGSGRWAVNLYAQRKDSIFYQIMKQVVPEVGRFAPFLGLPGISVAALNSFNVFYGAIHSRPEYLFKSNPVPVFGTAEAIKASGSSVGLPLRTGTYILVPSSHAQKLTPERLRSLELRSGFIVPKGTQTTEVYTAAASPSALPDVTYATVEVSVKPTQIPGSTKGPR